MSLNKYQYSFLKGPGLSDIEAGLITYLYDYLRVPYVSTISCTNTPF